MTEKALKKTENREWFVYMLRCADNTLYTGVTTNPERRLREHNSPRGGARYTRARQPVRLVYQEKNVNRSTACRREYALKQLSRNAKEELIAGCPYPGFLINIVSKSHEDELS